MANNIFGSFLQGHEDFTDIQKLSIPHIMREENCLVIAPTGSGKTEAVMLPILDKISKYRGNTGIHVIYITPLRALNRDMLKRMMEMCKSEGITIGVRHGDTKQSERIKQSKSAPNIIITTPETFQSILVNRHFANALKNVKTVVVDEIHEVYGTKRGAQLSIGLERLEKYSRGFQRVGISATVGNPDIVAKFLCGARKCSVISSNVKKRMEIRIEMPESESAGVGSAAEKFGLDKQSTARLSRIASLIKEARSTLIFANTRQVAEAVGSRLKYIDNEHSFGGIGIHHGSLDSDERVSIENGFKEGAIRSVIATSSLELGIDIGSVDLVLQYGSPRQALRLVQRVGRSGHRVGKKSSGVIIATNPIDAIESIAVADNMEKGLLEEAKVESNALDVLMHQVCGICLDNADGISKAEALKTIRGSYAYSKLGDADFEDMLGFMVAHKHIIVHNGVIHGVNGTLLFYYRHLSFISENRSYLVKDAHTNRVISSLDERFVVNNIEDGTVFITKGLPWRVLSVDEGIIQVEASDRFEAAVPDWSGSDIPVYRSVASRVFRFFEDGGLGSMDLVDSQLKCRINDFIKKQNAAVKFASEGITIEKSGDNAAVYCAAGTLANEALSRLIVHMLTARYGKSVVMKSTPYMIFFEFDENVDFGALIKSIAPEGIEELLKNAVKDSDLFRYEFVTVAKFFGVIDRDASVSKSMAKRIMRMLEDTPVYREAMRELMQNYFDIETLKKFLKDISGKRIPQIETDSISIFASTLLEATYSAKELVLPVTPSSVVLDSFIDSILEKKISLICTYCGFKFTRKLSQVKDMKRIECPNCKSPMVARQSESHDAIVKKRLEGKKLSPRERAELKELLNEASMFESYGGRTAVALSVYGIGLKSAGRILMMLKHDYRDLFIDLIEAQGQFIRTKKYWSA
ncbi:MAG: DEAD/DEAH box helicase [Candidatus Micrarchaeia archaeon]